MLYYTICVLIFTACDAKKCYATGRGIQPKGVRVNDNADFKVHTQGAGEGELKVQVLCVCVLTLVLFLSPKHNYNFHNTCIS